MDSHSSYKAFISSKADVSAPKAQGAIPGLIPHYVACVGLGLLGGALGVALTIGLAILIQLQMPPSSGFAPGIIPLMVTAAVLGVLVSWFLGRLSFSGDSAERSIQVILVSSVFTSLVQTLLFFM
ncbi:MAG: hypothetical protein Kow0063_29550 [Anaerolineae bacterium]